MKKIVLALALTIMALAASASSVRYFTRPQATRVARALDAQAELMIYCGYEYELATYVIINEVWAEPVNSKYYEIWLFGYDAYTGEEIYMPIDLSCIWLYNSYSHRMYSAAQYLRFRSAVATPNFYWTMPPYNPFVRHFHDPMFNHGYTYHFEIHRHGWRPPTTPHGGPAPYHPYYMRTPNTPAVVPNTPFTPGVNHPRTADGHGYLGNNRNSTGTRSTAFNNNGGERTGDVRSNSGNPGTTNRNSSANTGTSPRNSSSNGTGSSDRGSATSGTGSSNRGSATSGTGSSNRGSANTGTGSSNRGSSTTGTGSSNRGSANTGTGSSNRGSSTTGTGSSNRGTATSGTGSSNRGSSTSGTGSSTRGTSTGTTTRGTTSTNSRGTSTNTRSTEDKPSSTR